MSMSGKTFALLLALLSALSAKGHRPVAFVSRPANSSPVTTPMRELTATTTTTIDADLFGAAKQNATLQNDLNWTFGKKQQRGWSIYVPLISRLIGTEAGTESTDFAAALSRWQRTNNLTPNGILGGETMYRMIQTWQAARLQNRTPARDDQLITVPASEFYDASRPDEQRRIERSTYAAYQRLLAAAATAGAAEGSHLKIISAHRSREYQDNLRRKDPQAGSAGLAINSPHFTGRALDLYVGGDPVDTKDANRSIQVRTRTYLWLVKNAEHFGFRPYPYEPWHWEYMGN